MSNRTELWIFCIVASLIYSTYIDLFLYIHDLKNTALTGHEGQKLVLQSGIFPEHTQNRLLISHQRQMFFFKVSHYCLFWKCKNYSNKSKITVAWQYVTWLHKKWWLLCESHILNTRLTFTFIFYLVIKNIVCILQKFNSKIDIDLILFINQTEQSSTHFEKLLVLYLPQSSLLIFSFLQFILGYPNTVLECQNASQFLLRVFNVLLKCRNAASLSYTILYYSATTAN